MPPPSPPALPPRPPLAAGDCMVVGYASGGIGADGATTADFAIVLLSPLGEGQSISVTDNGWDPGNKGGAFLANDHHSEYHITHTAIAELPAGTVLSLFHFSSR